MPRTPADGPVWKRVEELFDAKVEEAKAALKAGEEDKEGEAA